MKVGERIRRLAFDAYGRMPGGTRQRIVRMIKPSFTVGVMSIITREDGAVLLVRHSYLRDWGIPGGLLDRREEVGVALVREAFEEVGLVIELVGEPAVTVQAEHQIVRVISRARPAPGVDASTAHPASLEIEEVRWFAPDALPKILPEVYEAIRALERAEDSNGSAAVGGDG